MTKEQTHELKQVLLGKTQPTPEGLVPMSRGDYRLPLGVSDGAGAVRILGVARRARRLDSGLNEARTLAKVRKVFLDMGRRVLLREQPEAAACLIRYVTSRPVLLVFQYEDGVPVLSAWAGRGLTAWISRLRAFNRFAKLMPKELSFSGEPLPQEEKPQKQKKKKRRKD